MQESIRRPLSILVLVYLMFIGQGCGNESPTIEFIGPLDSSIFVPDTIFPLEIIAYDPDGLITEYAYLFDFENTFGYDLDVAARPRKEVKKNQEIVCSQDDPGIHYMTVLVTDDQNASTEKTFHWNVQDFRDRYIGNWLFHVEEYKWDINQDPSKYDIDTIDFEGNISYGTRYYNLRINYTSDDPLQIEMVKDGTITDLDYFSMRKSDARFIGTDSVVLHLITDALGSGISLDIDGKKL